ncbi:MAG: hypothetical protein ACHQUB_00370 [Candidatus Saccharimonadia bacterium]
MSRYTGKRERLTAVSKMFRDSSTLSGWTSFDCQLSTLRKSSDWVLLPVARRILAALEPKDSDRINPDWGLGLLEKE